MKHKRKTETAFRRTVDAALTAGFRRASDGELLWLLAEIENHLEDWRAAPDGAGANAPADLGDAPDWDDLSAEELDALASRYEHQLAESSGTTSAAAPVQAPAQRPARGPAKVRIPAPLACEELEPRLPPSTWPGFGLRGHADLPVVVATRWMGQDDGPGAVRWQVLPPAAMDADDELLDHVLAGFDTEVAVALVA